MRAADWILLAASGLLMLAGPVMALQEWTTHEEAVARRALTGEPAPVDLAYRDAWRFPLLVLVAAVGVLGTLACVRALARPVTRAASKRLVALMLLGMTVLDLAFLADGARFLDEEPAVRAVTIVWAYPLGAFLVGGSAHRLAEVVDVLGGRAR